MNESQGRDVDLVSGADGEVGRNGRRYLSPNRVLARSFRISRDVWKSKHKAVQAKLEQQRQLAAERGRSREQWKQKCEARRVKKLRRTLSSIYLVSCGSADSLISAA